MNLKTYKLENSIFCPALKHLDAFCRVLQIGGDPQMKRSIYGNYEPHSDHNAKSDREKFAEDKNLLLEMLEEFHLYCRTTKPPGSRPPVEEELTRGLRIMCEAKEVTLPLAFAIMLFLDIHHILCHEVDFSFQSLRDVAQFVEGNVTEGLDFNEGIDMAAWQSDNDRAVQQFVDTLLFWCHDDQQLTFARKLKRLNIPKPFCLHRNHPWLCGMWKYLAQVRFHELSIAFCKGNRGRGELHCLSRDESRRAYEASHLG
jgi:hypothetical protein